MEFLKDWYHWWLDLLQEVNEHENVGIGGQAAPGGVADAARLGKQLGHVAKGPDTRVDDGVKPAKKMMFVGVIG